jgi:predicted RNase H-like HicB family nuclease
MVIMAKFTAMVEQAGDGSWTASVIGEHTVLGTGDTKEEAVEDLRNGIQGLLEYLKEKGLPLPTQTAKYMTLEVAA